MYFLRFQETGNEADKSPAAPSMSNNTQQLPGDFDFCFGAGKGAVAQVRRWEGGQTFMIRVTNNTKTH